EHRRPAPLKDGLVDRLARAVDQLERAADVRLAGGSDGGGRGLAAADHDHHGDRQGRGRAQAGGGEKQDALARHDGRRCQTAAASFYRAQPMMTQAAETSQERAVLRPAAYGRERGLPLRTLVLLRWLAIGGQTAAVVVAAFGLGLEVALAPALGAIGVSA